MKTSTNLTTGVVDNTVSNYIKTASAVTAVPRLTVDWNLNRYTTPTADNTPSEDTDGFDIETFPITSLYAGNRPTKGIAKAIVGQSIVAQRYKKSSDIKFYVGDQDDIYKYWVSPYKTNGSGTFGLHTDGKSTARPRVEYPAPLKANKIVIKCETSWATPGTYFVEIKTTTGGAYATIGGTSPAINALGVITLYYNGTAWVTTKPATLVTTNVAGIQFRVNTMVGGTDRNGTPTAYIKKNYTSTGTPGSLSNLTTNGANSNLAVIAIEPRFEADFTSRLINESNTFDMASTSALYPIGTLTSNDASIKLVNNDRYLDEENASSPYYGLLKQNAKVNLEYIFTINGVRHSVQQFVMYTGLWSPQGDGTTDVELTDQTKFFNDEKPRAFMWEDVPVTELVWRICDSVGFLDYVIDKKDTTADHQIPVFWSDGTKTVWELFDELAAASQTAIYIDSYGMLQVKTREVAFDETATPNIHLLGHTSAGVLPNIISLDRTQELHANKINVTYKATQWRTGTTGGPGLAPVWTPTTDSLVVRSTPLLRNVTDASNQLHIDQKTVAFWPYESKVQIDGEIIKYTGKEYVYFTGSNDNTLNTVWVHSQDDIATYDKKTGASNRYKNHLSGALKITNRGVWNSDQRNHDVDVNNWSTTALSGGAFNDNTGGFNFNRTESTVTINTPGFFTGAGDVFFAHRGSASSTSYHMYGTRIKFEPDGGATQRAGIGFQINGTNLNGYYVEIRPTENITATERDSNNEVQIFSRTSGNWTKLSSGHATSVRKALWYDVDVYVTTGAQDTIEVWLNGTLMATGTTTSGTKQTDSAKVAMYARGQSKVRYEYFYAIQRNINRPQDDYGFYDLKNGGIRGGQWELEHVWKKHTRWKKRTHKNSTKNRVFWTGYLFDEFGPYVHEVREFEVKFDPAPVRYSYLFSTNYWTAAPVEYTSNAFGAKFVIANISRQTAILQGADTLLFLGNSGGVNQVCMVLGRDLVVADDEIITKTNEAGIRFDGEVEIELSSDWIQTKQMGNDIAVWMAKHWSLSVDQIDVTIFGNPCYEIGDICDVDWPNENMTTANHKYFVIGVQNQFEGGLTTKLTLRRVNTADVSSLT